jgi:hypothetical protein
VVFCGVSAPWTLGSSGFFAPVTPGTDDSSRTKAFTVVLLGASFRVCPGGACTTTCAVTPPPDPKSFLICCRAVVDSWPGMEKLSDV